MMTSNAISKDNSFWFYLEHFKGDRARQIERLSDLVETKDRLVGPKTDEYNKEYLSKYFPDDEDNN